MLAIWGPNLNLRSFNYYTTRQYKKAKIFLNTKSGITETRKVLPQKQQPVMKQKPL
jgi:hypothetical protein